MTQSMLRGVITPTNPTVANATSVTLLADDDFQNGYEVQNNTAANIMINPGGGVLTGIVPSATNNGIVLVPGAVWSTPENFSPTSACTVYQASGGSVNTISVLKW